MADRYVIPPASNPYVNKVQLANGTTLIDLTADTVAPGKMLHGYTAHDKSGAQVTGNIPSLSATSWPVSSNDRIMSSGQYLSGTQTIMAVKTENLSAGNIKSGVVAKVGDQDSAGRIVNITGTFTSSSTATGTHGAAAAGQIMNGYSAWVNGAEIVGTFDMFALTVNELKALTL